MDAVYTYVDGDDPEWKKAYACAAQIPLSDIRFRDHGELVLSVQLLLRHAPWIRKIYVVYATMTRSLQSRLEALVGPQRLVLVPQSVLLNNKSTFSSCEVEAYLWRLPNITPNFLYLNDDMAIGRPVTLSNFVSESGLPWIDVSAVSKTFQSQNAAHKHNENAWRVFSSRVHHAFPKIHTSHFPSIMSVRGCRRAWQLFPDVFRNLDRVRTVHTINTQLLMALTTVWLGLGLFRTQAHRSPYRLAQALVENEPEGLAHVLRTRPHFFCINGISETSQKRFNVFARLYIQACDTTPYPTITRWHWSSESRLAGWRNGDDRLRLVPSKKSSLSSHGR